MRHTDGSEVDVGCETGIGADDLGCIPFAEHERPDASDGADVLLIFDRFVMGGFLSHDAHLSGRVSPFVHGPSRPGRRH